MQESTSIPSADEIKKVAEEVVSRSYYELESEPPTGAVASMLQAIFDFFSWLFRPVFDFFQWINGLPAIIRNLVVIFLILLLVALVAHIIYTIARAIKSRKKRFSFEQESEKEIDPRELEKEAHLSAQNGDFVLGIRCLYKAALVRIMNKDKTVVRLGMTNREHIQRLRRTQLFEPIKLLAQMVEQKWYGKQPCSSDDYQSCRQAHQQIMSLL